MTPPMAPMRRLPSALVGVLLATLVATSCAPEPPLRYMHAERMPDAEWGFPGSEARIDTDGRLAFSATTVLHEDEGLVEVAVTATNVSRREIEVLYRGCPVQAQLFEGGAPDSTDVPVWDSFGDSEEACPSRVVPRSVRALEDLRLPRLLWPESALRDTLPAGTYHVRAIVRPNGIPLHLPAGTLTLDGRKSKTL